MNNEEKVETPEELLMQQSVAVGEMCIATSIVLMILAACGKSSAIFIVALVALAIGILMSPIYPIGNHAWVEKK